MLTILNKYIEYTVRAQLIKIITFLLILEYTVV